MRNAKNKNIMDRVGLAKRMIQITFFVALIGSIIWLILNYKQKVSELTFYHFLLMLSVFISVDIILHIKYKENKMFLKYFDLFAAIILGVLTYIFAVNTLR